MRASFSPVGFVRLRRAWIFAFFAHIPLVAIPEAQAQFAEVGAAAGVDDAGNGSGVAWGDYDGDGDPDLYVSNFSGSNRLYRNDGIGFADVTAVAGVDDTGNGSGAVWGDYDNDGDLDLYLTNRLLEANRLFRNDGIAFTLVGVTTGVSDPGNGWGAAWADYDNDGDLDLYLSNDGSTNRLFRNDAGAFTDVSAAAGVDDVGRDLGVAWGDYDSDGDVDLYVAKLEPETNKLFRNDGTVFADMSAAAGVDDPGDGVAVVWGDYDNDEDLDLYVANFGSANKLYRNDGSVFADVSAAAGVDDPGYSAGAVWWDYENDGDLDVYPAHYVGVNRLYRNDGSGFTEIGAAAGVSDPGDGLGAACGDYDDDGDLDLYVANAYTPGENRLYRNDAASGNHWLTVGLVGTVSNRSAIGTRVLAVANGTSRVREVSGGSGYMSQSSLPVEFGLGSATMVEYLEIRWPSGVVQSLNDVAADQRLSIAEATPTMVALNPPSVGAGVARLSPAFPNPFRSSTTIDFTLPRAGRVTVDVFNPIGRRVARLADRSLGAGRHLLAWSGRDAAGRELANGVYFYRIEGATFSATSRVVKVR